MNESFCSLEIVPRRNQDTVVIVCCQTSSLKQCAHELQILPCHQTAADSKDNQKSWRVGRHEWETRALLFCLTKCWVVQPFLQRFLHYFQFKFFHAFLGWQRTEIFCNPVAGAACFLVQSQHQHLISLLHDSNKTVSNRDSFTPQQGKIGRLSIK